MRTRVTRSFSFDAAHQLDWHPGKCRRLHGHHYRLEVTIEGPMGPHGIVMDFDDLKGIVTKIVLDHYDHQFLNDFIDNPTAELVAQKIWSDLSGTELNSAGLALCGLRLWETPNCSVEIVP
ncbi:MAG: 6-carboxytetrahydropterin synthase QueD [Acidimicrobiales bacterium]